MIHHLIRLEQDMDQVIHGVNKLLSILSLSNYSLTSQLIIINIFTAILGFIFFCAFNYLVIYNDKNIDLKINNNNKSISKISNYLAESAILRVQIFNEDCVNFLNKKNQNINECNKLVLSEPQLNPSVTQKYLIQNFLDKDFKIIIYDNLKRIFIDTEKIYIPSEVVEIAIKKPYLINDFYNKYKNFYLNLYQDINFFFVKKKYEYLSYKFLGNTSLVVETEEKKSKISNFYFDDEKNLIHKISAPIIKNNANYGIVLLTSVLNLQNIDNAINSFNSINLYFIIIIIMFLSSLFFSRSIVSPIKLLSKITKIERDKSLLVKKNIIYPKRRDEIGQLSNDIKNMSNDLKKRIIEIEELALDVSHELKNPLAGLKIASELLKTNKLDEKNKKLLIDNIGSDVERMNTLISDISNYTLTQVEISKEIYEQFAIHEFLKNFRNTLLYKNHYLDIRCVEKKIYLKVNKNKFSQVLVNLLDNSLSFSLDKTRVKILINVYRDNKFCIINFVDNGPGISLAYKDKIFDRFYTDREFNRKLHSGIGLSISKNIIDSFGGEINLIKNTYKGFQGACFEIKLPLKD